MYRLLKPGRSGRFAIKKKTIQKGSVLMNWTPEKGMHRIQYTTGQPIVVLEEYNQDGDFVGVWMSDTPYEWNTNAPFFPKARGDVLIGGLGLGLVPTMIAGKPEVRSITIVEKEPDIIKLTWPQIRHPKMKCFQDDFFRYLKYAKAQGLQFDVIQCDIWHDPGELFRAQDRLRAAVAPLLKPGGESWFWLDEHINFIKTKVPQMGQMSQGFGKYAPCLGCGKDERHDFQGFCMDCADTMGFSEAFIKPPESKADKVIQDALRSPDIMAAVPTLAEGQQDPTADRT